MKKSLLQILLGVMIGGSVIVVVATLVLSNGSKKISNSQVIPTGNKIQVSPQVDSSTPANLIKPEEVIASQTSKVFAQILSYYSVDNIKVTSDSITWVGLRPATSTVELDEIEGRPLELWQVDEKNKITKPIAFFPKLYGCGGISWGYESTTDEAVVHLLESPCEGYSEETIYAYGSNGQLNWLAMQHSSRPVASVWPHSLLSSPLEVEVVFDKDCSSAPFDEFNPTIKTPTTKMIGLAIKQPAQSITSKSVRFDVPTTVECGIMYGGGYANPGLASIDYQNGQFSFGLPDKTKLVIDPLKYRQGESYLFVDGHTFK